MIKEYEATLKDHEERIAKLEALFTKQPQEPLSKKLSIAEFLREKHFKSDVQASLAIANFLEKFEQMSSFNIGDLEKGFRQAKQPIPKNLNDVVYKNIKKGHMMQAEEKKDGLKAWCLTSDGERYVDNDFKDQNEKY